MQTLVGCCFFLDTRKKNKTKQKKKKAREKEKKEESNRQNKIKFNIIKKNNKEFQIMRGIYM